MNNRISRRRALGQFAVGGVVAGGLASFSTKMAAAEKDSPLKGRIHHSVCRWCYSGISLDALCQAAKAMGIESVELLMPEEWPTAKKYGLTCAMASVPGTKIARGFNRVEHHDELVARYEDVIPKAADAGLKNVICLSGNRAGLDDEQGLKNCVLGLKRIVGLAERKNITLVMELLNSKTDHKDFQGDHTAWGVEVCRQVGSERLKLLYDIYHMQIMEGDLIATIKKNAPYIAHYHTGGVPGRAEIDETQEVFYPAIMRAIVETGFQGFVGQEMIPRGPNPLESLRAAVRICDV